MMGASVLFGHAKPKKVYPERMREALNEYLRACRKRRGMTQLEVVLRMPGCYDRSTYARWENGTLEISPEAIGDLVAVFPANEPEIIDRYMESIRSRIRRPENAA